MTKPKTGTIITPPGVLAEKHEKLTADYLATKLGWDVTFLVPNRHRGSRTPDIEANQLYWEMKSPKGKSARTIENVIRQALKQSPNLRRMDGRIPTKRFMDRVELEFQMVSSIKYLIVITRDEKHIDFQR